MVMVEKLESTDNPKKENKNHLEVAAITIL